ncbi:hypothetical protein Hanom_Chr17g01588181 [Helianthus anomalus]
MVRIGFSRSGCLFGFHESVGFESTQLCFGSNPVDSVNTRVNSGQQQIGRSTIVNDFGLDFGSDSRIGLVGQVLRFSQTARFGLTRPNRVNSVFGSTGQAWSTARFELSGFGLDTIWVTGQTESTRSNLVNSASRLGRLS